MLRRADVTTVTPDERSVWLKRLDAECPYQIVLPRRQLTDDSAIMDFPLSSNVGKFEMQGRIRPADAGGIRIRAGKEA